MGLELGRLVQQRRHDLGLSRRDLAGSADVSYPYLSQIETGDRDPSLRTMRKLADALSVPVEQMAGLVAPEEWLATGPQRPDPAPAATYDDPVEGYRKKILPTLERRLAAIPPLIRLQLLTELQATAIRELTAGHSERG